MSPEPDVTVYTDGACLGNPGPGGWAWAVPGTSFASGPAARTTNQRMELEAALEALRANNGPVTVVSDSTYVVNCFRDRWWEGWIARGWINKAKKPVANRDLWEPLIELYVARSPRPTFRWVKGHSGDKANDLVDRLAVEAARTQEGRSGLGWPKDLGAADSPGGADRTGSASDGTGAPPGFKLVVAGHRPPEIGGYGDNATATALLANLVQVLGAQRQIHPDAVVLTGLGLGAEQIGAAAAAAAGVPYMAVLPYPDQEAVWPKDTQNRYRELLEGAQGQIVIQSKKPDSRQQAGGAMRRRDAWLARHGDEAIVVYDGDDALVGRMLRSLQEAMGEEQVWVIPPPAAAAGSRDD